MTTGDKVLSFPGAEGLPENPITIEPRRFDLCRHDRITLDEHSRTVRCTDCQKVFDPFAYLMSNAHSITEAWRRHREVVAKAAEKIESIDKLSAEERRLKARLKALREKAEPGINIRGTPPP